MKRKSGKIQTKRDLYNLLDYTEKQCFGRLVGSFHCKIQMFGSTLYVASIELKDNTKLVDLCYDINMSKTYQLTDGEIVDDYSDKECLIGFYKHPLEYMEYYKFHGMKMAYFFLPYNKIKLESDPMSMAHPRVNVVGTLMSYRETWYGMTGLRDITWMDVNEIRRYYDTGDTFHLQVVPDADTKIQKYFSNWFVKNHNGYYVPNKIPPGRPITYCDTLQGVTHDVLHCTNKADIMATPQAVVAYVSSNLTADELQHTMSDESVLVLSMYPKKGCVYVGNPHDSVNKQIRTHLRKNKSVCILKIVLRNREQREKLRRLKHPFSQFRTRIQVFYDQFRKEIKHNFLEVRLVTK